MVLIAPDSDEVLLARPPFQFSSNLVSTERITFDDSVDGALDPRLLGDGLGPADDIPRNTYFAQGLLSSNILFDPIGEVDPVNGLGNYTGTAAEGNWTFEVRDLGLSLGFTGTIESVDLTIRCEE